jgi:hypothetical protein
MRNKRRIRLLTLLTAMPPAAWCQVPVISSIANSASYQPVIGSPGAILSVFGTNLAATTVTAGRI